MQTIDDFKQENKQVTNIYNDIYINLFSKYKDSIFMKDDETHQAITEINFQQKA